MSDQNAEPVDRDDGDQSAVTPTPTTGLPAVDAALASLADLGDRPVNEHPEALSAAHEALHESLHAPSGGTDR